MAEYRVKNLVKGAKVGKDDSDGRIEFEIENEGAIITRIRCHCDAETIKIPSSVQHNGKNYPVTGIIGREERVYSSCTDKRKKEYGSWIHKASPFGELSSLKEIILPNPLKSVGKYSFYNIGLKKLRIPNGVEEIGDYAFDGYSDRRGIEQLIIPSSVKKIGRYGVRSAKTIIIKNKEGKVEFGDNAVSSDSIVKYIGSGLLSLFK